MNLLELEIKIEESYSKQITFSNKNDIFMLDDIIQFIKSKLIEYDPDNFSKDKDLTKVHLTDEKIFKWIKVFSSINIKSNILTFNIFGSYLWRFLLTIEEEEYLSKISNTRFLPKQSQAYLQAKKEIIKNGLKRVVKLVYYLTDCKVFRTEVNRFNGEMNFEFKLRVNKTSINLLEDSHVELPMIVKPQPIINPFQQGYCTENLDKNSIILNTSPNKNNDYYLEYINYVNSIPVKINNLILQSNLNYWKGLNEGDRYEILDKRKAFNLYNKQVKELEEKYEFHTFDSIYFTHNYDTRGRFYPRGYHYNPQGTGYNKACIMLAEEEILDKDEKLL